MRWLGSDHMQLEHTQGWSWETIRTSMAAARERTAFREAGGVLVGKPLLEECSLLPREGVVLGHVQVLYTVKVVVSLRQPAENIRILVRVSGGVIGLAWVLDLH